MKIIQEINILKSKKIAIILNILAVPLLIFFAWVFTRVASAVIGQQEIREEFTTEGIFLSLVIFIGLLVIHELIHGLFFKVFKPENKVKFGIKWSQGMAYATSPGSHYTRAQMMVIGMSPFALITLGLTLALVAGLVSPIFYVFLAAMHAAGCIGDFYYAYLLVIKHGRKSILVEDTETGLIIYQA